jgi:hypothetical protein
MWIPYRCSVLLLVLIIVKSSCVKSSLTSRTATDVIWKVEEYVLHHIDFQFPGILISPLCLCVCACILMCLCVLWICLINFCIFFQKFLLRVCWMSTKMFSFVKLPNVNFHILLAFITQLMILWVITMHRMSLSSALGDYAWRLIVLWIWENYTTWVHCLSLMVWVVEMDALSCSKFIPPVYYFCQLIELLNYLFSWMCALIFFFMLKTLFEKLYAWYLF